MALRPNPTIQHVFLVSSAWSASWIHRHGPCRSAKGAVGFCRLAFATRDEICAVCQARARTVAPPSSRCWFVIFFQSSSSLNQQVIWPSQGREGARLMCATECSNSVFSRSALVLFGHVGTREMLPTLLNAASDAPLYRKFGRCRAGLKKAILGAFVSKAEYGGVPQKSPLGLFGEGLFR